MNMEESELPQATNFPFAPTDMQLSGEDVLPFCLKRKVLSNLYHRR